VCSKGHVLGVRTELLPGLQTSLAVNQFDFDSDTA